MIYIKTGSGGDKTNSAMGLAARALGNGKRVVIIQFMKGRFTGELEAFKRFSNCDFKQFGRHEFVDLDKPAIVDKRLAHEGLDYAHKALGGKPFLLVLDELNLACAIGLVKIKDVLALLKKAKCHVVITGRRAPESLMSVADFVTEYTDLKRRDVDARPGIEY